MASHVPMVPQNAATNHGHQNSSEKGDQPRNDSSKDWSLTTLESIDHLTTAMGSLEAATPPWQTELCVRTTKKWKGVKDFVFDYPYHTFNTIDEFEEYLKHQDELSALLERADGFQRRKEARRDIKAECTQRANAELARQPEALSYAKRRCLEEDGRPLEPARVDLRAFYKDRLQHKTHVVQGSIVRRQVPKGEASPPRKKNLLDMPLEVLRHIASYIFEDLEVIAHPGSTSTRVRMLNKDAWNGTLSAYQVSWKCRRLFLEAFKWEASHGIISLVLDVEKCGIGHTNSRGNFPLKSVPHAKCSHHVPNKMLRHFASFKIILPVAVLVDRIPTTKSVTVTLQRQAGDEEAPYRVTGCTWHHVGGSQLSTAIMQCAEAFDCFETRVRRRSMTKMPAESLAASIVNFTEIICGPMLLPAHFQHNVQFSGTKAALNHAYLLRQASSREEPKLGWRGTAPFSMSESQGDGVSFLTKWKPCAEEIRWLRVEETIVKLGWRGSPAFAHTLCNQQDSDEQEMTAVTDWLAGLDATADLEADRNAMQKLFEF